ncbi:MAG: hypothetical protein Q7T12_01940 [Flavobacterium sp.]|nr:hypothetical protein [Flavobacterium sp.]
MTEERHIKKACEILKGYTKDETEYIFEKLIPDYLFQAQAPNIMPKYKIVDRITEEEYTVN